MIDPIPPKYHADYLLDNTERCVVSDESVAREYLETFYRALVDNGLRWPMLDFNDLMTAFRSSGELVMLPTIESSCVDDLGRILKEFLIEEHIGKYDIVLLTLCTSTQCVLDNALCDLGFKKRVADVTGQDIKLFAAPISSEKKRVPSILYMGSMIIHQK